MKKHSFLNLFVFCLMTMLFVQCSQTCEEQDCSGNGTCVGDTCLCDTGYAGEFCEERLYLLKSIELSNEEAYNFEYDSENRISRIWHGLRISGAINILRDLEYLYNGDTIIINDSDAVFDFENVVHRFVQYGTDSLVYTIDRPGGSKFYHKFSGLYDECGYSLGVKDYDNILGNNDPKSETYEYGDNCELIIRDENGEMQLQIEFDDRNFIHQNNVNTVVCCTGTSTLEQVTNGGNIVKVSGWDWASYESTYTYNEADFPVEEVRRMQNGAVQIFRYNYY